MHAKFCAIVASTLFLWLGQAVLAAGVVEVSDDASLRSALGAARRSTWSAATAG